jgi:hypothetical protein
VDTVLMISYHWDDRGELELQPKFQCRGVWSPKAQLNFSNSLSLIHKGGGRKCVSIGKIQQERLCEMAFIILFTAWEQFLENTFITLIVDAPLATFKRRHRVLVTDFDTAYDLIRGSRKYVEWADPT